MENVTLTDEQFSDIDGISQRCGDVTVGCSDVAGVVTKVIESFNSLRDEHDALKGTVDELSSDQQMVNEACDEARLLSERALERLGEGRSHIRASLGQIASLLEAVQTLAEHITGFAAAMDQVKRSSQEIEDIADKTNILALNAAIEAHRAGDAGRTFSVVANEVKSLAGDAHRASNEITRTIDALGREAEQVMGKISHGAEESREARKSVSQIEDTIGEVCELIGEVDGQNEQIVRNSAKIGQHVGKVETVLNSFSKVVGENEASLVRAHDRMEDLELTASGMFDALVKSGLSPADSAMVEKAQEQTRKFVELAEQAIASGEISESAIFDKNYTEIPGSNPKRYRTGITDWADRNWQPLLDETAASHEQVVMTSCSDINGFLPTHLSRHSRTPTGDLAHDTQFCRNGRIIFQPIDKRAKASTEPYMMAVYRQEGDGRSYRVVRNVYIPMIVNGKRWGDVEVAYSFD